MKSYFLVKDSIPVGWAILSAAHAAVQMLEHFREDPATQHWLNNFRKVVVRVTDQQFEEAKRQGKAYVAYSDPDYGDDEMVLAFKPDNVWPGLFRKLPLYK